RRSEGQQRPQQVRTVGQTRALLVNNLRMFTLEDGDVGKLSKAIDAAMFDHQQPRFDILEYKSQTWNLARRTPDVQLVRIVPNTQMNSRTFNCRSKFCQDRGS